MPTSAPRNRDPGRRVLPGWELTIDGQPAPIYRTNRMMRGAAVPSGRHRLVYTFNPRSFRLGRQVSGFGLGLLLILVGVVRVWPFSPRLKPPDAPDDRPEVR
ncbi:MAG: YfhO family protein [Isosphaeraceae bacterium]